MEPEILAAIEPVITVLQDLDIAYYIGGSLASSAFGVARATLDVDLIADIRSRHIPTLCQRLGTQYYIDEKIVERAVEARSSFNVVHLDSMIKLDVFIVKDEPFHQEALKRRIQDTLALEPEARLFFLPTPEDIVLFKLQWYEAGERVSETQWNDVLGVIRVQGRKLDFDYLNRWAKQLGLTELLDEAREEARL
jgi:hypothetical protein